MLGGRRRKSWAGQYREHLLASLRFLMTSQSVSSYARGLATSCGLAFTQLQRSGSEDWELSMEPWSIELLENPTTRGQEECREIVMAARILAASGELKYQTIPASIIIGPQCFVHQPPWRAADDNSGRRVAIRRMHFDYDANVTQWSRSHLQIGGNPAELATLGKYHFAMSEDPSEPRIPYPIYDWIIVLDLMLREFATNLTLPQEPAWRALVRRSEELLLRPYFQRVHDHLQSSSDQPLADFLAQS